MGVSRAAVDRLATANLRVVLSAANRLRGYGLPLDDLVQEGCVGVMLAALKDSTISGPDVAATAIAVSAGLTVSQTSVMLSGPTTADHNGGETLTVTAPHRQGSESFAMSQIGDVLSNEIVVLNNKVTLLRRSTTSLRPRSVAPGRRSPSIRQARRAGEAHRIGRHRPERGHGNRRCCRARWST